MAKKGKTPSLIGGGAGASRFVVAQRKRKCKRCAREIPRHNDCVEVNTPGSMGHRTYCTACFGVILGQSQKELDNLKTGLAGL